MVNSNGKQKWQIAMENNPTDSKLYDMYSNKNLKKNCCKIDAGVTRQWYTHHPPDQLQLDDRPVWFIKKIEKESLNGGQLWTRLSSALTKDLAPISLSQAVVDTPSSAARIHLTPGLAYLLTYSTYTWSVLASFQLAYSTHTISYFWTNVMGSCSNQ